MKHTPGTWMVSDIPTRDRRIYLPDSPGAPDIAVVLSRISRPDEETAANARLIAATPAMADALDCIVRRLQMDVDDGSRPDQWSMEDLIRTAKAALPADWVIGA
jgi:hypothetical protein